MENLAKQIKNIVNNKIRPRTRVDGGDILFNRLDGKIVYIDAYADCAVCQCCEPELTQWIGKQIQKELGIEVVVKVKKNKPYYA